MIDPIAVPKGELGKGTGAKVTIFPSLIQLHSNVVVTLTDSVADLPEVLVLQRL